MSKLYAVIDSTGLIVNVTMWDGSTANGEPTWAPPEGHTYAQIDNAVIGGTYISGTYTPPVQPAPPAPTAAQQAAAALAAGIALTSTTTPSLNGSYPVGPNTETYMIGIIAYIGLKATFPGGNSSMNWYDASNTAHSFSVANFEAFAEAMCAFIQSIAEWQLAGGSGSLPSNQITIP